MLYPILHRNNTIANIHLYLGVVRVSKHSNTNGSKNDKTQENIICLIDSKDILQKVQKDFTITTNNGSYHFNQIVLKDLSFTISDLIKENPNNLQFNLDINDDRNVTGKFEQICRGETVALDSEDLPIFRKIIEKLLINNCQNELKPESLGGRKFNMSFNNFGIEIEKLTDFLKNRDLQTFTIKTNKNKYKCNIFGVSFSDKISDFIGKKPMTKEFVYDFDDENNEFQNICDLFNFKNVEITKDNIDSLKNISEDLQINYILDDLNNYIKSAEKISQVIDDNQRIIDTIDELFDLLYNINVKTVKTVKNSIVMSNWVKTEENVQELVSFIIQTVKTDIILQPYLIELITQLNEEANESNYLNVLQPFLISKLLLYIPKSPSIAYFLPNINFSFNSMSLNNSSYKTNDNYFVYAFIYKLYKKGIIAKEELIKCLKNYNYGNRGINAWFLPLLVEINHGETGFIQKWLEQSNQNPKEKSIDYYKQFIGKYLPDKIDLYEKMLDNGEPDDEITKALRNDDVDKFQTIITNSGNIEKIGYIPYNIYDDLFTLKSNKSNYDYDMRIKYIDYAAAFGSLKCFKYLILNHKNVDDKTFDFAIYGGNSEIIKIVEQKKGDNSSNNDILKRIEDLNDLMNRLNNKKRNEKSKENDDIYFYQIMSSITKHRNEIFDWILDNDKDNNFKKVFKQIAFASAENGNAYALIDVINRGLDITQYYEEILSITTRSGFYRLTKILLQLKELHETNKKSKKPKSNSNSSIVSSTNSIYYGNYSIFKLFIDDYNESAFKNAISICFENNNINIINYMFDDLITKIPFLLKDDFIQFCLSKSLNEKTDKLFNLLLSRYTQIKKDLQINYMELLQNACQSHNIECIKIITDIILNNDKNTDFSPAFNSAVSSKLSDICQYFIDKNVTIFYDNLDPQKNDFSILNEKLFNLILSNVDKHKKPLFLNCIEKAIKNNNKELVDHLLKEIDDDNDDYNVKKNYIALAIQTDDIKMVNIILKYYQELYIINKIGFDGTLLTKAVCKGNVDIVKLFLSIPGINPSLPDKNGNTPLVFAVKYHHLDIINAILDFYGEDIQNQEWQLEKIIKIIYEDYLNGYHLNNHKISLTINRILEIKCINPNYLKNFEEDKKNKHSDFDDDDDDNKKEEEENDEDFDYNYDFDDEEEENEIEKNDEKNNDKNKVFSKLKKYRNNCTTFLLCACYINDIDMVKCLLELPKVDVNQFCQNTGDSPLMISIRKSHLKIAELLLKSPKIDINHRNYNDQTVLLIAVKKGLSKIVSLLIKNQNFDPKANKVNQAFTISNSRISKQLISIDSIDVNYQYIKLIKQNHSDKSNQKIILTPLSNAIANKNIDVINFIIQHPSFDKHKSKIDEAIFDSVGLNNFDIFQKMFKMLDVCDVNICDSNGRSLLDLSIRDSNEEVFNFVFNHEKFDSKKSKIQDSFVDTYSCMSSFNWRKKSNNISFIDEENVVSVMNKLLEYDKEHDHLIDFSELLPDGKSFFTSIASNFSNIEKVVEFLLDHGVDPNAPDKYNVYPLEKAISIHSFQFANTLIKTNKIDYSVKIPKKEDTTRVSFSSVKSNKKQNDTVGYTTYLHLAVKDQKILEELLKQKLIDVNMTDDIGNTALMDASVLYTKFSYQQKGPAIFDIFFERDDLDYLHKNNNDQDALDLRRKNRNDGMTQITDRNEYLKQLKEKNDRTPQTALLRQFKDLIDDV